MDFVTMYFAVLLAGLTLVGLVNISSRFERRSEKEAIDAENARLVAQIQKMELDAQRRLGDD